MRDSYDDIQQKFLEPIARHDFGQMQRAEIQQLEAFAQYQRAMSQLRHEQRNSLVNDLIKMTIVGAVCLGGVLLCLAIFASATKPPEPKPPRINESCILFCGGGNR